MSSVRVAVRCRPVNDRERELNSKVVVRMQGNQTLLTNPEKAEDVRSFTFDHAYWSSVASDSHFITQEQVFADLGQEVLDNAWAGYNACIFAYGQTGSGKSYSMMGTPQDKGIIPRLCEAIFDKINSNTDPTIAFKVEVSYMEIYNEKVRDLLNPANSTHSLRVREHPVLGPYVEDLSKLLVSTHEEILRLMEEGNMTRTVAATSMNAVSSRSHAIFNIIFTQIKTELNLKSEKVSKISLVDLAGSERAGKSGTTGDRLKEGANINKSLTTLGLVIKALVERSGADAKTKSPIFVPYRDSVLTWLIKDNLGGNSKTIMIATLSPAAANYEETLSTLRYADSAKQIVNKAVVNEDETARVIRELKEEIAKLRDQLQSGGGTSAPDASGGEVSKLRDQLLESERLIKEMSMSWEDRRRESERIQEELFNSFRTVGKAVTMEESGLPHLVNMTEDARFSDVLLYHLPLGVTRIGSSADGQDIVLDSEDVAPAHAIIEHDADIVYISPVIGAGKDDENEVDLAAALDASLISDSTDLDGNSTDLTANSTDSADAASANDLLSAARGHANADTATDSDDDASISSADTPLVFVNGRQIFERTRLQQGHFVALGRTHLFRFNHPGDVARAKKDRVLSSVPSGSLASLFGIASPTPSSHGSPFYSAVSNMPRDEMYQDVMSSPSARTGATWPAGLALDADEEREKHLLQLAAAEEEAERRQAALIEAEQRRIQAEADARDAAEQREAAEAQQNALREQLEAMRAAAEAQQAALLVHIEEAKRAEVESKRAAEAAEAHAAAEAQRQALEQQLASLKAQAESQAAALLAQQEEAKRAEIEAQRAAAAEAEAREAAAAEAAAVAQQRALQEQLEALKAQSEAQQAALLAKMEQAKRDEEEARKAEIAAAEARAAEEQREAAEAQQEALAMQIEAMRREAEQQQSALLVKHEEEKRSLEEERARIARAAEEEKMAIEEKVRKEMESRAEEERQAMQRAFDSRVKEFQQQQLQAQTINAPTIQVLIPRVELVQSHGKPYHVYQIAISLQNNAWQVFRRFSQFADLHARIRQLLPAHVAKHFPKKTLVGARDPEVVEMRRERLQVYMRGVVAALMQQPHSPLERNPTKQALCEALPFLSPDYEAAEAHAKRR